MKITYKLKQIINKFLRRYLSCHHTYELIDRRKKYDYNEFVVLTFLCKCSQCGKLKKTRKCRPLR